MKPASLRGRWLLVAVAVALLVAAVAVNSQLGPGRDIGSAETEAAESDSAPSADAAPTEQDAAPVTMAADAEAPADSAPPASGEAPTEADDESLVQRSQAFGEPEHPVSGAEPYIPSRVRLDEPGPPAEVCLGKLPARRVQLPLRFASTKPRGVDQLSWSPDCRRMLFRVGSTLWVANGDGTGDMPFLTAQHGLSGPAWSPDGEWIAFTQSAFVDGERASHIYIVKPDALGLTQVSEGLVFDQDPAWSPNGERLAFSRRVRVADGDNAGEFDQFIVAVDMATGTEQVLLAGAEPDATPSWSPDGELVTYGSGIAMMALRPPEVDPAQVLLPDAIAQGAAWSPDGSRLAAFRHLFGDQTDIVVRDLPGLLLGGQHRIDVDGLERPLQGVMPTLRWSESGQHLLFHAIDSRGSHWAYRFAVPPSSEAAE